MTVNETPIHALTDEALAAQIVQVREGILIAKSDPTIDPSGSVLVEALDLLCSTVRERSRREAARELLAAEGVRVIAPTPPLPHLAGSTGAITYNPSEAGARQNPIKRDDVPHL